MRPFPPILASLVVTTFLASAPVANASQAGCVDQNGARRDLLQMRVGSLSAEDYAFEVDVEDCFNGFGASAAAVTTSWKV